MDDLTSATTTLLKNVERVTEQVAEIHQVEAKNIHAEQQTNSDAKEESQRKETVPNVAKRNKPQRSEARTAITAQNPVAVAMPYYSPKKTPQSIVQGTAWQELEDAKRWLRSVSPPKSETSESKIER